MPGTKPLSPEQQRIRELEQRIKILEEDKEILKRLPRFLCHSSATLPSGKGIKIVWNKACLCVICAFRTDVLCAEKAPS
ncbi:hypothetical protein INT80_00415 [Gallibacterium anatis]|uniref:Transposase n=1 Tax=Gallibacterium anatis TaxID=750 RepID=A0A930UQJ4_9PAST|nr:hypothetical protein [Gallibacterium anatis]